MGSDLNKKFDKPPLPNKSGTPRITIVRVTKQLTPYIYGTFSGFSVEIDDEYAYIKNDWMQLPYARDHKKPDWMMSGQPEMIIWFSQSPYNTVIIHQDKKYALMHVKRGLRRQVVCSSKWCKSWHVEKGGSCVGHNGAPPGFNHTYDKHWILKPVILPPESEAWVTKHLAEVL